VLPGPTEERIAEPLARLVGSRSAKRMLATVGASGVTSMPASELASACEVPLRVAERLVAARAVMDAAGGPQRQAATNSTALLPHIPPWLARAETEFLIAFALDTQLHVKATVLLAKGGTTSASVAPRDVFVPLVRLNATAFALAHNHPSGNLTPSPEDVALTNKLVRLGRILEIRLVDHLVVAVSGLLSFHDAMLLPTQHDLDQWDSSAVTIAHRP